MQRSKSREQRPAPRVPLYLRILRSPVGVGKDQGSKKEAVPKSNGAGDAAGNEVANKSHLLGEHPHSEDSSIALANSDSAERVSLGVHPISQGKQVLNANLGIQDNFPGISRQDDDTCDDMSLISVGRDTLVNICRFLSVEDIKALRLASSRLSDGLLMKEKHLTIHPFKSRSRFRRFLQAESVAN